MGTPHPSRNQYKILKSLVIKRVKFGEAVSKKSRCSIVAHIDTATLTDQMCATSHDASHMG